MEPAQGPSAAARRWSIHGNGFQPGRGGVTVTFGKRPATSVVVASADKINVMTPGGDPNTTVDVTVVFDDGKAFKLGNGFHYMAQVDQRGTLDKAFNSSARTRRRARPPRRRRRSSSASAEEAGAVGQRALEELAGRCAGEGAEVAVQVRLVEVAGIVRRFDGAAAGL